MGKKFEITEEAAQAILNYLAERPFKEVMNLIPGLMQLKPMEANPPMAYKEDKETENG